MDIQPQKTNTVLRTRLILIFVFGFALGALTVIAWNSAPRHDNGTNVTVTTNAPGSTTPKNNAATSTENVPASFSTGIGTGRVAVTNQPAGNTALVESVTVPPPGVWVAIRETNGKELGNILGAEYVHGPRSNVSVSLLRNTQPNKLYVVELYRPGVKEGIFNVKTESVYVDLDTGRSVIVPFRTEANTPTGITQ